MSVCLNLFPPVVYKKILFVLACSCHSTRMCKNHNEFGPLFSRCYTDVGPQCQNRNCAKCLLNYAVPLFLEQSTRGPELVVTHYCGRIYKKFILFPFSVRLLLNFYFLWHITAYDVDVVFICLCCVRVAFVWFLLLMICCPLGQVTYENRFFSS